MRVRFRRLAPVVRCATMVGLLFALTACERAPDLSAVVVERGKSVQRFDTFLAAASAPGRLVGAGGGGVIVVSADGGKTWDRRILAAPSSIVAMTACPDGTLAALDFYRKVWTGDREGRGWSPSALSADFNPVSMTCDPRGRLWVVGSYSTVLSSADKGRTWQAQPPGEDAILTAVQFVDESHGVIAGEFGTLLVTSDAGMTWSKQPGLPTGFYPYAMHFDDPLHGWMSGVRGALLATADGGRTWTAEANPGEALVYALVAADGELFGVGRGGRVLWRHDGAWTAIPETPPMPSMAAAVALDSRTLLLAGEGGALQAVDIGTRVPRLQAPAVAGEGRS